MPLSSKKVRACGCLAAEILFKQAWGTDAVTHRRLSCDLVKQVADKQKEKCAVVCTFAFLKTFNGRGLHCQKC